MVRALEFEPSLAVVRSESVCAYGGAGHRNLNCRRRQSWCAHTQLPNTITVAQQTNRFVIRTDSTKTWNVPSRDLTSVHGDMQPQLCTDYIFRRLQKHLGVSPIVFGYGESGWRERMSAPLLNWTRRRPQRSSRSCRLGKVGELG
jgi:hypothetical protein